MENKHGIRSICKVYEFERIFVFISLGAQHLHYIKYCTTNLSMAEEGAHPPSFSFSPPSLSLVCFRARSLELGLGGVNGESDVRVLLLALAKLTNNVTFRRATRISQSEIEGRRGGEERKREDKRGQEKEKRKRRKERYKQ